MTLHDKLAASHPSLRRGKVWCRSCGASQRTDAGNALRHGWPRCCGVTMTIDSPAERPALPRDAIKPNPQCKSEGAP